MNYNRTIGELPDGRPIDALLGSYAAKTLAAPGDDVLGYLVDQGDRALQALADDGVDGLKVRLDQGANLLQGH